MTFAVPSRVPEKIGFSNCEYNDYDGNDEDDGIDRTTIC